MTDVIFIVLPGTLLLDLAGPAEAFRLANQQLAKRGRPPPTVCVMRDRWPRPALRWA
jgi:transcriptional regulator GlxA family with amidase domain